MATVPKQVIKTLLLTLFVWSTIASYAQELTLKINNGLGQYKEELLQPIAYTGYLAGVGLQYTQELENGSRFQSELLISGMPSAKTKLNNDMSNLNLNIDVAYLFDLNLGSWKTGPALLCQYDYSLYALNYEHPFWITQYALNWKNNLEFRLTPHTELSCSVAIPLLNLISRTPREALYSHKRDYQKAHFHENMSMTYTDDLQSITTHVYLIKKRKGKNDIGKS